MQANILLKASAEQTLETSVVPVGKQIRELRKAKGLTLSDMKALTGRSVGNLSEMERGTSPVTIEALGIIADALDVNINWFFSGSAIAEPAERDVIVRKNARREINLSQAGTREELLSPHLAGQLELILTTFAPGAGTGDAGRIRKGEEGGMVISGTLELTDNDQTYLLEAGDSFQLIGAGRHWCYNPGDEDTVVFWAMTPVAY